MKKIIITQRIDKVGKFNEIRDNLDIRFSKMIETLGMLPFVIPNNIKKTKIYLNKIKPDGIILSPGGDSKKRDQRRKIEHLLINYSLKYNKPILGLCRGAQAINLFFGGNILKVKNHVKKMHKIEGKLIGKNKYLYVNSFHDYAIKYNSLGKNLETLAHTKDGIVECFRHKKKKILGIMWHPERYKKIKKFDRKIIKKFFKCN